MEGRDLVRADDGRGLREGSRSRRAHGRGAARPDRHALPEAARTGGYAWGMSIDLATCIGCNACVVACQAENNIPVVGKDQVLARPRDALDPRSTATTRAASTTRRPLHQPVPCMHCENAPCEVVCPVGATVHSAEGLNEMVYNRCVGTRYCSNNCPYKVRRFNFFLYSGLARPRASSCVRNPDVTVRSRGVMEKCTLLRAAHQPRAHTTRRSEDRPIRDGEIVTACQQACPADAIVFGNLNDPSSRGREAARPSRATTRCSPSSNTRPRTTYLAARARIPNPELGDAMADGPQPIEDPSCDAEPSAAGDAAGHRARPHVRHRSPTRSASIVLTRQTPLGWFVGVRASAFALTMVLLLLAHLPASSRASASGASTSRSAGASPSSTSSGGSASATPAR